MMRLFLLAAFFIPGTVAGIVGFKIEKNPDAPEAQGLKGVVAACCLISLPFGIAAFVVGGP